jgi:hypothetical protein
MADRVQIEEPFLNGKRGKMEQVFRIKPSEESMIKARGESKK